MSDRQKHLAEIEARRRAEAPQQDIELFSEDLSLAPEDNSYNPYDKPGPRNPRRFDIGAPGLRRALKKRRR